MMNASEFAAKIKAKYPEYQNVDDSELAARVVAKHPEYKDQVDLSPQPAQTPAASSAEETARALFPRSFKANDEDAGIGRRLLSAAGDAVTGLIRVPAAAGSALAAKAGLTSDTPTPGMSAPGTTFTSALQNLNQGKNEWGDQSMVAGMANDPATVPTALVPVGELGAAAKAAPGFVGKLAQVGGKVGLGALQGLKMGAVGALAHQADNYAQGKDVSLGDAAKEAATNAAVGGAIPLVGEALQGAGKGILNTVIKPGKIGAKRGFEIGNVFDQGIDKGAYTLEGIGQNAEDKIAGHTADVKSAIADKMAETPAEGQTNRINVSKMVGDVESEFQDLIKNGKMAGEAPALEGALKHWEDAFNKIADPETGEVPLDVANNLKSSLQQDAKKYYEAARTSGAEEPSVKEKVASALAKKLRAAIEDMVPDVKEPNAAMSKLIPVRDAIESRNIIANQNQGLGLGRLAAWGEGIRGAVSGHLAELLIPLAYEVQRSPLAAAKMLRLGQALQRPGAQKLGVLANPAFTGADSQ